MYFKSYAKRGVFRAFLHLLGLWLSLAVILGLMNGVIKTMPEFNELEVYEGVFVESKVCPKVNGCSGVGIVIKHQDSLVEFDAPLFRNTGLSIRKLYGNKITVRSMELNFWEWVQGHRLRAYQIELDGANNLGPRYLDIKARHEGKKGALLKVIALFSLIFFYNLYVAIRETMRMRNNQLKD